MENKPNFYAIIPAYIRYDKSLPPGAKLLYGEITALANRDGNCYASNQYFSELYDVDTRTIQSWINQLIQCQYVYRKIVNNSRRIRIVNNENYNTENDVDRGEENFTPHEKNFTPHEKNFTHNNTVNNTRINDKRYKIKDRFIEFLISIKYITIEDLKIDSYEETIKDFISATTEEHCERFMEYFAAKIKKAKITHKYNYFVKSIKKYHHDLIFNIV